MRHGVIEHGPKMMRHEYQHEPKMKQHGVIQHEPKILRHEYHQGPKKL